MDNDDLQKVIDDLGQKALEVESKATSQAYESAEVESTPTLSHPRESRPKWLLYIALICIAVLFWKVGELEIALKQLYAQMSASGHENSQQIPSQGNASGQAGLVKNSKETGSSSKGIELSDQSEQEEASVSDSSTSNQSPAIAEPSYPADQRISKQSKQLLTPKSICLFDLSALGRPALEIMEALRPDFQKLNFDIRFEIYKDGRLAAKGFNARACDILAVPDSFAREFNFFTGTFNAPGAMPSYEHLNIALSSLLRENAKNVLRHGEYEVIGILPLGATYLHLLDKKSGTPKDMAGLSLAVFDSTPEMEVIARKLGMNPVKSDVKQAYIQFSEGEINAVIAPAWQGSQSTDMVMIAWPVQQTTLQLIMRIEDLPSENFARTSREIFFSRSIDDIRKIQEREDGIPDQNKLVIDDETRQVWQELFRESRIELREEAVYDAKALKLFRKVRCQVDPKLAECTAEDKE